MILESHFLSLISKTLTSVKKSTLVTRMQNASTPLDHMHAIVSVDLPEMDKIAQVNFDIFYLNNREASTVFCSVTKPTGSS